MHRSIRRGAALGLTTVALSALVAVVGATPALAASTPPGIRGMDISEYQGAITSAKFTALAESKYAARFVYIKASGGMIRTNTHLVTQWSNAGSAGLVRGAYHLAAPNLPTGRGTGDRATAQADYFLSKGSQLPEGALWKSGGTILPPMLDLEVNTDAQQPGLPPCYGMSQTAMRVWISTFSAEVKATVGRAPVLYTNTDFWSRCVGSSTKQFSENPLFFAKYTSNPAAGPGVVPANWAAYSLWQYSDTESPFPGDQDVYNGTLASLRLLADPTYGFSNTAQTRKHDYNGDGKTDILAISSTGTLYDYRGNGAGAFLSPANVSLATGLKSYNAFAAVGQATSTGNPGLYARGTSGTLYYFPVSAAGHLGTRIIAATGWQSMSQITSAGDFTGDGYADLLSVDKVGVLWLSVGDKTGKFTGRVQLATGWNTKTAIIGGSDFTGDGRADLLARDSAGKLALYSHVPTTAGLVKTQLATTGWANYTRLFTPGDFTGDGRADVMAIGKSGQMYVFPGTGDAANPLGTRRAVGTTTSWGTRPFLG